MDFSEELSCVYACCWLCASVLVSVEIDYITTHEYWRSNLVFFSPALPIIMKHLAHFFGPSLPPFSSQVSTTFPNMHTHMPMAFWSSNRALWPMLSTLALSPLNLAFPPRIWNSVKSRNPTWSLSVSAVLVTSNFALWRLHIDQRPVLTSLPALIVNQGQACYEGGHLLGSESKRDKRSETWGLRVSLKIEM